MCFEYTTPITELTYISLIFCTLICCLMCIFCLQRNLSHRWLAYESSPIDWCEDNYRVNPYVAEFVNTISNILLVIFPLFVIRSNIWHSYLQYVSVGPHVLFYMMSCVGLGSIYFHGTLSLLGQFIDEISLMWCFLSTYIFLFPTRMLPKIVPRSIFLLIALALSVIWFIDTEMYRFWLFAISVPTALLLAREYFNCENFQVRKYVVLTVGFFFICSMFWFVDFFFCDSVKSFGFPGLHFVFHIFMPWVSYFAITLLAFFRADCDAPHIKPSLRTAFFMAPYVYCEKK